MLYTITARISGFVAPGEVRTEADTAKQALAIAEKFDRDGRHDITISNAEGDSFDLDQFRLVVLSAGWRDDAPRT
jgi:hypothetical protein